MINPNQLGRRVGFPASASQWMLVGLRGAVTPPSGIQDGDTVTAWPDSSGNGNNATKVGAPIFKTNIVNGKPVVRFSTAAASGFTLATPISGGLPWAVFAVMKQASAASTMTSLIGNASPGLPLSAYPTNDGVTMYAANRGGYNVYTSPSVAFHVYAAGSSGDFTVNLAVRIDGTPLSINTNVSSANTGDFAFIGWNGPPSAPGYTDGDLAEVLIYTIAISPANIQNIEKYLGTKYAITVAGGTNIDPTTVPGLVGWWKADALL